MSHTLSKIYNAYPETDFVTIDGFADAVIGVCLDTSRLIYSASKCIDILIYDDDMIFEEAVDYFDNIVRNMYKEGEGPIFANTEFL